MSKVKLSFETNRCKGCGLCVEACPLKILTLDETTVNIKGYHPVIENIKDKCVACSNCSIMCPDCVITIERMDG